MKKIKSNPYLLLAIIYVLYVLGGLWLYKAHSHFANSSFFFATVTFVVGSFALFVYNKQQLDIKTNAATTVIFEIRNAEAKIDIIIEKLRSNNIGDLPSVLPTNNWRKYSHLFVRDFDIDQLQLLNSFYNSSEIIEDFVNRQNNFFWISTEERAKVAQRMLATIHDEFQIDALPEGDDAKVNELKKSTADKKFNVRKYGVSQFSNEAQTYTPNKTVDVLKFQTENIQKITSTPTGEKLKKLAKLY